MGEYQDLVKSEAKKFLEGILPDFANDADDFGGKSKLPNFAKWMDRTAKLNQVVDGLVSRWSRKEFQWVQSNTRNPSSQGGDPKSNCYGSVYSDILHEIKKLKKQK